MHLTSATIHPELFPTTEYYPFNLDILRHTGSIGFTTPVTFFVGENGSGKSTLLTALCRTCGIHIWGEITRTRYERNPYEEQLHRVVTATWADGRVPGSFFASQTFQNFTKLLDEWAVDDPEMFDYFGGKSLITQSHGQSLMAYFRSRYRIRGLYFLDEPETALSPKTQLELLAILGDMSRAGHAQFIIATHSPILLSCPGSVIYSFDTVPVSRISYEETEHFKIYRDFMAGIRNA